MRNLMLEVTPLAILFHPPLLQPYEPQVDSLIYGSGGKSPFQVVHEASVICASFAPEFIYTGMLNEIQGYRLRFPAGSP